MCVLFDLNLPEDDNIIETSLCSADMMTNMYTPATATDCKVHEKKKEFWKLWAPNSEASPIVTERCCRAPASCSSSSFPGQESTFCSMSQLWMLVSQGSVHHIQLHSGLSAAWLWSCFYCGLKWSQVHFWNVYLEEHILALQSPRMCKISFLLLYSLWHLFSFPCRVPGGRSATLPLALEIVVRAFIKVEGGGGNSRGLFIV